jgi:hypothetical protein
MCIRTHWSPCFSRADGADGDRSHLFINEQLGVNVGAERPENNQRFAAREAVFLGVLGSLRAKSLIIFRAVEIGVEAFHPTFRTSRPHFP